MNEREQLFEEARKLGLTEVYESPGAYSDEEVRWIIRERSEIEKLRYAMKDLTKRAEEDDPNLRAFVLTLGHTLGFGERP